MRVLRKRFIPDEIIDISGDELIFANEKILITRWIPIKPRDDISRGISFTILEEGWKISKIFDGSGDFLYWYCDIIEYTYENDTYMITDLLVDLKVYKDGAYEILDLDELEIAYEKKLITFEQKKNAENKLKRLVSIVEAGKFPPIDNSFLNMV